MKTLNYAVIWKDSYTNKYEALYFETEEIATEFANEKVYKWHGNYYIFKGNECIKMLDAKTLEAVNKWRNKEVK